MDNGLPCPRESLIVECDVSLSLRYLQFSRSLSLLLGCRHPRLLRLSLERRGNRFEGVRERVVVVFAVLDNEELVVLAVVGELVEVDLLLLGEGELVVDRRVHGAFPEELFVDV